MSTGRRRAMFVLACAVASAAVAWSVPAARAQSAARATPVLTYRIVATYPHDPEAFTQGLLYRDGFLFESTGLNGRSTLRKVRLETGDVVQQHRLDSRYFAEGLTDWGTRLVQLTYQTNVGFVYDRSSFAELRTFGYSGQGWGLTHDDRRLIMSDGTAALRFLDPETFRETGRIQVRDGARAIDMLNELEVVKGQIYANVWLTDRIAVIAPGTGQVTAWIDLTGLRPRVASSGDAVLNGIAYDAARDRLFVTGKLWPRLFEITVQSK